MQTCNPYATEDKAYQLLVTLIINHTVTSVEVDGKDVDLSPDTAKTKSSLRTLPLVPVFKELLLKKKAEQKELRRLCGKAYCTDFLDSICVDQLGKRTSPDYLTEYFPKFLTRLKWREKLRR